MTIYLDVILFLNFCIDYLLLALTAIILKRTYRQLRLIAAATFASTIVFFLFTPLASVVFHPIIKCLYSVIIVYIAFGFQRWSAFLQGLFTFYFVSFMTGGALFALHFFGQSQLAFIEQLTTTQRGYFGSGINWLFVVIGFPLVWLFSKKRIEAIEWKNIQYDQIVSVNINIANVSIETTGLIDSGNQLTDPLTKKPVMIVEASLLYPHFTKETIDKLIRFHEGGIERLEENDELLKRVSIVPYRVVGQSSPFLTVIRADSVTIVDDRDGYVTKDVLLGLESNELSPDGAFHCIVHPKLVIHQSKQLASSN